MGRKVTIKNDKVLCSWKGAIITNIYLLFSKFIEAFTQMLSQWKHPRWNATQLSSACVFLLSLLFLHCPQYNFLMHTFNNGLSSVFLTRMWAAWAQWCLCCLLLSLTLWRHNMRWVNICELWNIDEWTDELEVSYMLDILQIILLIARSLKYKEIMPDLSCLCIT